MIVLIAHLRVHADRRSQALSACHANQTQARNEDGCLEFGFYADPDDANHFVFAEKWASREALDAHFATPHFADFMAMVGECASEAPSVDIFTVSQVDGMPS